MSDNVFILEQESKQETHFFLAKVKAFSSNMATLNIDGDTNATVKKYKVLNDKYLETGDRVLVAKISGTYIVLGKIS